MTIRILLTGCLSGALLVAGCGTTRNNISGKAASGQCASIPYVREEPVLSWQKAEMPREIADTLPARFRSYKIDAVQLDSFFSYSRKPGLRSSFSVPLPEPLGCQYFEVSNAGIMDMELAERYPRIISLKGNAVNDRSADVRVDYDGNHMRAQITWGATVYLVSPVQTKGGTVYIVYQKQDSREVKEPFEQKINPRMIEPAAPLPVR